MSADGSPPARERQATCPPRPLGSTSYEDDKPEMGQQRGQEGNSCNWAARLVRVSLDSALNPSCGEPGCLPVGAQSRISPGRRGMSVFCFKSSLFSFLLLLRLCLPHFDAFSSPRRLLLLLPSRPAFQLSPSSLAAEALDGEAAERQDEPESGPAPGLAPGSHAGRGKRAAPPLSMRPPFPEPKTFLPPKQIIQRMFYFPSSFPPPFLSPSSFVLFLSPQRLKNPKVEKAEILQKTVQFLKTQPLSGITFFESFCLSSCLSRA